MGTKRKARKLVTPRQAVKPRVGRLAKESAETIAVAHRQRTLAPELKEADPHNPWIPLIAKLRRTTVKGLCRIRQGLEVELRRADYLSKADRKAIEGQLQLIGMVESAFDGIILVGSTRAGQNSLSCVP